MICNAAALLVVFLVPSGVFGQFRPTIVGVVPAERRSVPSTLTLVGSVRPYVRSLVASEVAGMVEKLPAEEGDRVEAGTPICYLRDTIRRLAYAQSQERLKELEARLAELRAGTRKEDLARAKAVMEEAQAMFQKWAQELERIKSLRQEASASQKEYNDTVAEHAAARERLAQSVASYELAVAGPRKEVIARAGFAVEAQRVRVDLLKYDLDQTVIRAPFPGYITRKHAEVGEWITIGGPVIELMDLDRVLVRVDMPEAAISAAKVGDPASVDVDALRKTFRGKIVHIIPQADEKARTFPVEIEIKNKSHELKAGMFVRARVRTAQVVEAIVVPRDSILQRNGSHLVVTVLPSPTGEGEFATPIPVQLGAELGAWVAISSPAIQPGTPVAVKGHDRIYGPQPVKAVPAKAPSTQPAGPSATQPAAEG